MTPTALYPPSLRAAMERLVPEDLLAGLGPGQRLWTPWVLMFAAVLMSWQRAVTLKRAFDRTRSYLARCWPGRELGDTYTGLSKALQKHGPRMLRQLGVHLRQRMEAVAGPYGCVAGWLAFGVDGTKINCPRTRRNKRALRRAGRSKSPPQRLLTVLYHLGLELPWAFKVSVGKACETVALRAMAALLPVGALLVGDAKFVGYDLLRMLQERGVEFLVRVGRNVPLLKGLGFDYEVRDGIVYLWPQQAQRRRGRPLVCRLIVLEQGRKRMYLLTSVLDPSRLSVVQAKRLYRRRWKVELFFRSFKQTMAKRQLLCRAPRQTRWELSWAVMGLWLLGLAAMEVRLSSGRNPSRLSVAGALDAVDQAQQEDWRAGPRDPLRKAWRQAGLDPYRRRGSKASHRYPRKKRERPPGRPKLRQATPQEVLLAKELAQCHAA